MRHLCICPSTAAVMAFPASVPDGGGAGGLMVSWLHRIRRNALLDDL
ncbi:hypothetical protein I542_4342 [Mycobacteroides abscessus 1948]|uniref:Uncharacterized protein n=1 Tax=Mycobacteroides abscessus 1948 TaxID=1299323 RepID=A0A829QMS1_9MYCO|nr:hypothetical protein I542_4342 [Mycobacteroides abscessus 1948]